FGCVGNLSLNILILLLNPATLAARASQSCSTSLYFPSLAGNPGAETSSLETASSSAESSANLPDSSSRPDNSWRLAGPPGRECIHLNVFSRSHPSDPWARAFLWSAVRVRRRQV